ncbi:MAG: ATP-binding protein [Gemmatimonadota bacterium]
MLETTSSDRRAAEALAPPQVLYFVYASRLVICLGVYGAALIKADVWLWGPGVVPQGVRNVAVIGLSAAAVFTPLAYWFSHWRKKFLSRSFLYLQAVLDVALVTGIVHITGGFESRFAAPLYIALAAAYALVLPLRSALIVALATGVAYLADVALAYPDQVGWALLAQLFVFMAVASAASLISGRLRVVRGELQDIRGELSRHRLTTGEILHGIPTGVISLDPEGKLEYMNPAAASLLGVDMSGSDWQGRTLLPELEQRAVGVARVARQTLDTGMAVARETVLQALDAPTAEPDTPGRPVAVTTSLLGPPKSPSLVALIQDLTEARALESLRMQKSRLEAVAELSASLAHEIRNPLAAISSAVELLARRIPASSGDNSQGRLRDLIVRETDRLDGILGDFNDFARMDTIVREPIEVGRLLDEVVELARQHPASSDRATITTQVTGDLDGLWGDSGLLHRTLLNLLLNALQVGEPGSQVTVQLVADTLPPRRMAGSALDRPVRIRIIDDGPGVAPEDLPRIFDPFFSKRDGGSGLGLAIAHRAVRAHGGELAVQSVPAQGATFEVLLPRRLATRTKDSESTEHGTEPMRETS